MADLHDRSLPRRLDPGAEAVDGSRMIASTIGSLASGATESQRQTAEAWAMSRELARMGDQLQAAVGTYLV